MSQKTIYINGRSYGQRVTGVQRYGIETIACLDQLIQQGEGSFARWVLLLPPGVPAPELKGIRVEHCGRFKGHLWEQLDLPWRARGGLIFSPGFTGPLWVKNQIVTVHDGAVVRFPQTYSRTFSWWYRSLVSRIVQRAPATMAVSEFSAGEAVECFGAPASKVHVATEGWQHLERRSADERILDRHQLRHRPFVLAVSSHTPNKNFAAVVRAIELMGDDGPLVAIAGAADISIFSSTAAGSAGRTIQLGYVTDEELKALYSQATCFVMASFYEGFGIPPLEAMACGCPVISSTAAALQETCGAAALYFDPHDPAELARHIARVVADPELRQQLKAEGLKRTQHYSWERNARLHLELLEATLASNPRMQTAAPEGA
ncbi:glycosyltransferase involved in cell wall biosynthesis [Sphaerotilus hippei]|uniref:Glycosyltransferase involved in cell wall biosynthesis n=1 Tax=Sphaerotilus hippei TaxID=744406 RepID=A0A318H1X1_9BURK|nr:glycosyltransferase family 1 protein [Sphaerotilus hippei]PXW97145.1 glycosyltransferase involved in cell wall biosynthesis [Sphaerotilus hippei]